jgi:molybdopterin synthase sulfurtransferase
MRTCSAVPCVVDVAHSPPCTLLVEGYTAGIMDKMSRCVLCQAVSDGCIDAQWRAAGYAIETTVPHSDPVTDFGTTLPRHPEYLIGTEEARAVVAERDATLVSIRSWAEYIGATSGYRYIQPAGRIAGDVWGHAGVAPLRMDHYRNVDNTMRNYHAIAARWRAWGVTPDQRVAFYCGTGWRASEAFFYAALMGWVTIAVYDGGWGAWVQDPTNPIAVGAPRSPWRRASAAL